MLEEPSSFIRQQDPERIRAERRAERKHEQVDEGEAERQEAAGGHAPAQEHARADMRTAPQQRDRAHHRECRRGDAGGKSNGRAIRAEKDRERTGGEQQQRHADEHRERAPERTENGEDADVALQLFLPPPAFRVRVL